jgi:hypothetical protein
MIVFMLMVLWDWLIFRAEEHLVGNMAHTWQFFSGFQVPAPSKNPCNALCSEMQRRLELMSASFSLPVVASPHACTYHLVVTCLAYALGSIVSCIAAVAPFILPVGSTHGTFGQNRCVQCPQSWEGSYSCTSTPTWLHIGVLSHASLRGSWPMCNTGT